MKKAAVLVCMASVLLSGCSGAGGEKVSQTADSSAQAVASELAKTDWTAVSTDINSDDAAYVMAHRDTVALDRLIAFTLTADGGPSEGACEELRSRFLESPHTVLAYLVLMGDQTVSSDDSTPAAEFICGQIASAAPPPVLPDSRLCTIPLPVQTPPSRHAMQHLPRQSARR